jgi:ABC-type Zn2+ transport system substrate-binding protein/surface adhesin
MAKTKYHNLEKQDYNNCNLKDFMTLMRLEFFVKNYLEKVPYKKCITVEDLPKVQELWLKFKHQKTISAEGFNRILSEAQLIVSKIANMIENSDMTTDYSMDNFIYDINNKLILKRIKET